MSEKEEKQPPAKEEAKKQIEAVDGKKKSEKVTKKRKIDEKVNNIVDAELPEEVEEISKKLKETNKHLLKLILDEIGLDRMKELEKKTFEVYQGEGLFTSDKSRKKTVGGVFLHLAKEEIGNPKFNSLCKQNNKVRKKQKNSKTV